jgi:GT2 family glycosyltransferase
MSAKAGVIVFSDDDVVPSPQQLSAYLNYFSNSRGCGAAGPVLAPGERLRSIRELSELERSRLTPGRFLACFDADFRHSIVFASGANCAFRKSAILELGGFDEQFTGSAWGEDYEFCYRLRNRFGSIEYLPEASIVHLTAPTGGCRDLKAGKYVRNHCRNSTYTHLRTNAGLLATVLDCWCLLRRFVINRRAFTRPRLHWIGHVAIGCWDGYLASRLPRKLPLSPKACAAVESVRADVGTAVAQ